MNDQLIALDGWCDDVWQAFDSAQHPYRQRRDPMVMTIDRRLHAMGKVFLAIFQVLDEFFKSFNIGLVYVIDRFFVTAGDNLHLPQARFYPDEAYRSAIARQ